MKVSQDENGIVHAELTEGEHAYMLLALEIAIAKYRENSILLRGIDGHEKLSEQFNLQEQITLDLFNELNDL